MPFLLPNGRALGRPLGGAGSKVDLLAPAKPRVLTMGTVGTQTPVFQSSAYRGAGTHTQSQWLITRTPGMATDPWNLVHVTGFVTSLTSLASPVTLSANDAYFVRVRHVNSYGRVSEWSEPSMVTTRVKFTQEFGYTGGDQAYRVDDTGTLWFQLWSAAGGHGTGQEYGGTDRPFNNAAGGYGSYVYGYLNVTKGDALTFIVGEGGASYAGGSGARRRYGGGGKGSSLQNAGDGGGRTAVLRNGVELLTAGAGGGSAGYYASYGGNGGYPNGGNGFNWYNDGGGLSARSGSGGGQNGGGVGGNGEGIAGQAGWAGNGGDAGTGNAAGGGGGGAYGGGGGGANDGKGSGGGGSSKVASPAVAIEYASVVNGPTDITSKPGWRDNAGMRPQSVGAAGANGFLRIHNFAPY